MVSAKAFLVAAGTAILLAGTAPAKATEISMPGRHAEVKARLIAADRLMTARMGEGFVTRTERRRRLEGSIQKLETKELRAARSGPVADAEPMSLKRRQELALIRRIFSEFRGTLAP